MVILGIKRLVWVVILCCTSAFGVIDIYVCSDKIVPGGYYISMGILYFPPEVSWIEVIREQNRNYYSRANATYDSELNMYYI